MLAVDTNILVRYLIPADDPKQADRAEDTDRWARDVFSRNCPARSRMGAPKFTNIASEIVRSWPPSWRLQESRT